MMRKCHVLRVRDDEQVTEKIIKAISEVGEKLFADALKNNECINIETLNIGCRNDFDPGMIRVEGTVEVTPRMPRYADIKKMYINDRWEERKAQLEAQMREGEM